MSALSSIGSATHGTMYVEQPNGQRQGQGRQIDPRSIGTLTPEMKERANGLVSRHKELVEACKKASEETRQAKEETRQATLRVELSTLKVEASQARLDNSRANLQEIQSQKNAAAKELAESQAKIAVADKKIRLLQMVQQKRQQREAGAVASQV